MGKLGDSIVESYLAEIPCERDHGAILLELSPRSIAFTDFAARND